MEARLLSFMGSAESVRPMRREMSTSILFLAWNIPKLTLW